MGYSKGRAIRQNTLTRLNGNFSERKLVLVNGELTQPPEVWVGQGVTLFNQVFNISVMLLEVMRT